PALAVAPEPELESAPAAAPKPAAAARPARGLAPLARVLGAIAAAVLLATAATGPVALVLPFPWLGAERDAFHGEADTARLLELDLAAKTFFLLEGRFPDRLPELVEAGLLDAGDLVDSRGRSLVYESREASYAVRPVGAAPPTGEQEGPEFRESVAGNFLLDPEFLQDRQPGSSAPPLVLLD
ncbi:MAG: hypothetical protein ACLF0P_16010, partial [Thermoanaerobaculia bacterium]